MAETKIYNSIYPTENMAKAETGITIFLTDKDVKTLLSEKKMIVTLDDSKVTITYLQGDSLTAIQKKPISPFGKGYFHIPVGPLGLTHTSAYVVPADTKNEALASEKEKEVKK